MAAVHGPFLLACLAWASLDLPFPRAEGTEVDGSCEKHLRSRLGTSELGSNWGAPLVLLGILFAAVIKIAGYAVAGISYTKNLCAQGKSGLDLGCSEFSPDDSETRVSPCGSPGPACSQSWGRSQSPMCLDAQQAYARQLTCMEKLMEGFLVEVRSRRQALEKVLGEDVGLPSWSCTPDKLNITVYEIADRA